MFRIIAEKHALLALTTAWLFVASSSAHAQTLLRWKFQQGETLRYAVTEELTEKAQLAGKGRMTVMFAVRIDDAWKIDSVDKQGVATIDRTIDRMRLKAQGPQGILIDFDTATDKELTGIAKMFAQVAGLMIKKVTVLKINPRGEIVKAKQPQGLLEGLKKILPGVQSFGDFLSNEGSKKMQVNIRFPEEPVTKGRTWTHKEDIQLPAMFGTLATDEKYEYLGTERRGGGEFQKIALTVSMGSREPKQGEKKPGDKKQGEKAPGKQKQASPLLTFKDGDSGGTIYFDNVQGHLVESNMKVKMQIELNVPGKKGTADIEGTVRIELQPAGGGKQLPKP
jgi:hypothetical protein